MNPRKSVFLILVILAAGLLWTLPSISNVYAGSGNTVTTSSDVLQPFGTCTYGGYYYDFILDVTLAKLEYASSATGTGSWTVTSITTVAGAPTVEASVYCDGSGDFAYAYVASSSNALSFRAGTLSSGTLSYSYAQSIVSISGSTTGQYVAVGMTSLSNLWLVGVGSSSAGENTFSCNATPTCTNEDTLTTMQLPQMLVESSSTVLIAFRNSGTLDLNFRYTTNSGGSWTTSTTTTGGLPRTYGNGNFIGSNIELLYTTGNWATYSAGGSFSHTSVDSSMVDTNQYGLSGDQTSKLTAFFQTTTSPCSSSTTLCESASTNSGTSWGADTVLVSGEAAAIGNIYATLQLSNGGVTWEYDSAGTYAVRYTVLPSLNSTLNLTCIVKESGAASETLTLSGGSPSPSTAPCTYSGGSGSTTAITVTPPCTLIVTVATDGANTRYRFNSSSTSATTENITCPASGSGSTKIWNYYQLSNSYTMTPLNPANWDHTSYSEALTGTYTGVGSTTLGTFTLTTSSGAVSLTEWADYNTQVSLVQTFASSVAGTWTAANAYQFTDTTGNNSHNTNYDLELAMTLSYALVGGGSPTAPTLLCSVLGVSTNTTLTMSPASYTCDYGTFWAVGHNPLGTGSSPNAERWYTGNSLNGGATGQTLVFTFYRQEYNSYSMLPNAPPTWDANYAKTATGTYLGTGSSTICSLSLTSGGSGQTCNGFSDYNTQVNLPSTFASSISGTWTALGTFSWTDTTSGNSHATAYDLVFASGFTLTLTKDQSGSPTLTFTVTGCAASPTTVSGDGAPHTFASAAGCNVTVQRVDSPTDRVRFDSGGANSVVFAVVAGHSYSFTFNYQLDVTVTTSDPGGSFTTPSGSMWYNYGTTLPILVTILPNSAGMPIDMLDHWASTNSSNVIANPSGVSTSAVIHGGGTLESIMVTITYSVIQPNPLTVVFWVFPFIITMVFLMQYLFVAIRHGATTWARNYMLVTGLNVGVLMAIMSETMPFPVLILTLITWFLYAYRG